MVHFDGGLHSTGGVFDTYSVVQGIDRFIPVDMYVPGCPPRPEQLIQSIIDLQDKIQHEGTVGGREFATRARQQPKRALIRLADHHVTPGHGPGAAGFSAELGPTQETLGKGFANKGP